jgi:hypothetical protein
MSKKKYPTSIRLEGKDQDDLEKFATLMNKSQASVIADFFRVCRDMIESKTENLTNIPEMIQAYRILLKGKFTSASNDKAYQACVEIAKSLKQGKSVEIPSYIRKLVEEVESEKVVRIYKEENKSPKKEKSLSEKHVKKD